MPRYRKNVAENRKAFFDYHISDKFEAGIVLKGDEVKSLRIGRANLKDSFARIEKGEVWLYGMHVSPYDFARKDTVNPLRQRKLLLSKQEIRRLGSRAAEKGLSIIPLKVYFSGNYAKVELGLAKGKKLYDKRDAIKKRDMDREVGKELVDRERK